jgi:hypothetical protein
MSNKYPDRDYDSLFNPVELRASLLSASLCVLAFESFRANVIGHVRQIFWNGIDESGQEYDEKEYRAKILSRNRSPFHASLDWFKELGAIDDTDLAIIQRLRLSRNKLVHDLMDLIGTRDLAKEVAGFQDLATVYRKIEVWRVRYIELAGDPDWDDRDISDDDITPGPMIMMKLLTDISLGSDEEAWQYYKSLRKDLSQADASADGAS